jgi:hypothetical protein
LTAVHSEFVKMCLLAKCYSVAARVLDQDVLYLPEKDATTTQQGAFKIEQVLTYHYYGGMVGCHVLPALGWFLGFKFARLMCAQASTHSYTHRAQPCLVHNRQPQFLLQVYIGLKQFIRALQFLAVAITAPADCISSIMLESCVTQLVRHGFPRAK